MHSDFTNEYGPSEKVVKYKQSLIKDFYILSQLKSLKDFMIKKSTVIIKKMFSEIILLFGYDRTLIPSLVSNVIIYNSNYLGYFGIFDGVKDLSS